MPSVPEDLESWEAMVSLTPPAPILPPSSVVPAPGTGGESVIGEPQQGLRKVMEKLEVSECGHGPRRAGVGKAATEM